MKYICYTCLIVYKLRETCLIGIFIDQCTIFVGLRDCTSSIDADESCRKFWRYISRIFQRFDSQNPEMHLWSFQTAFFSFFACTHCVITWLYLQALWLIDKTDSRRTWLYSMHLFRGKRLSHRMLLLPLAWLMRRHWLLGPMYLRLLLLGLMYFSLLLLTCVSRQHFLIFLSTSCGS